MDNLQDIHIHPYQGLDLFQEEWLHGINNFQKYRYCLPPFLQVSLGSGMILHLGISWSATNSAVSSRKCNWVFLL